MPRLPMASLRLAPVPNHLPSHASTHPGSAELVQVDEPSGTWPEPRCACSRLPPNPCARSAELVEVDEPMWHMARFLPSVK